MLHHRCCVCCALNRGCLDRTAIFSSSLSDESKGTSQIIQDGICIFSDVMQIVTVSRQTHSITCMRNSFNHFSLYGNVFHDLSASPYSYS